MPKRLIWFYNEDCEYCTEMDHEIKRFCRQMGAELIIVTAGIIDEETGEPQVPALMYTDPKTENHIFLGRFCLEALRYTLENG